MSTDSKRVEESQPEKAGLFKVLYFAYASNMEQTQFQGRCPNHEFLAIASVDHYRLAFTRWSRSWNSGTADILPSRGEKVYGVLYALSLDDLKRLDKFTVLPQAYVRADLIVKAGREKFPAVTYVAVREGVFLPSQKYLGQIIKGAESYKLPKSYLELLRSIRTHD